MMKISIQQIQDQFGALSMRERLMGVVAVLAGLVYLGDAYLIDPERQKTKALQEQMAVETQQQQNLQDALRKIRSSRTPESLGIERSRRDELKAEVDYGHSLFEMAQSDRHVGGLAKMVIAKSRHLKLRNLNVNAPQVFHQPKPALANALRVPAAPSTAYMAASLPILYMHGVSFSVDGRYADLVQFLRSLETKEAQLFWPEIVMNVTQYPLVNLRATLNTLSVHAEAPLE